MLATGVAHQVAKALPGGVRNYIVQLLGRRIVATVTQVQFLIWSLLALPWGPACNEGLWDEHGVSMSDL